MTPWPTNDAGPLEIIETCNSTWIFDKAQRRFIRMPRGTALPDETTLASAPGWEPYDAVVIDPVSGAFLVRLNASGSRILRSMVHRDPCPRCVQGEASQLTVELEAIRTSAEEPPAG